MNLLCKLGVHNNVMTTQCKPSIDADIVTDLIFHVECERCKKVSDHRHLVWNGSDMVPVSQSM